MSNLNFRRIERKMGIKSHKNNKMINAYINPQNAKQLEPDHYNRLINQKEVYRHKDTGLIVVRTDKNRTIKVLDPYRIMELRIIKGNEECYPFVVFDNKAYTLHKVIAEAVYGKQIEDDEDIHHIDCNKKNYEFENLAIMKRSEHIKLHKNN